MDVIFASEVTVTKALSAAKKATPAKTSDVASASAN
jgi:hypothetical protein